VKDNETKSTPPLEQDDNDSRDVRPGRVKGKTSRRQSRRQSTIEGEKPTNRKGHEIRANDNNEIVVRKVGTTRKTRKPRTNSSSISTKDAPAKQKSRAADEKTNKGRWVNLMKEKHSGSLHSNDVGITREIDAQDLQGLLF
jgi:hypothetical protein